MLAIDDQKFTTSVRAQSCHKLVTNKDKDTMFANQPVLNLEWLLSHHVGNKAKGRISKRVFQEKEARQIFQNTNIS